MGGAIVNNRVGGSSGWQIAAIAGECPTRDKGNYILDKSSQLPCISRTQPREKFKCAAGVMITIPLL
jgi:hypothetical protein